MKRLWLDFETRSDLNLKKVGLDNYAKDPSTQVLMLAYAFDNEPEIRLWQPAIHDFEYSTMPADLWLALQDPSVQRVAWNYNFERMILKHVLSLDIDNWYDPSVLAAYLSFPVHLGKCGAALDVEEKKSAAGTRLIKMFSERSKALKKMLNAGSPPLYFKTWETHPEQWAEFAEYCKQDVRSEREICHMLESYKSPLPEFEQRVFAMDQRINARGIKTDPVFIENAKKLAIAESEDTIAEMAKLTGIENPNSTNQLGDWLRQRGYPFDSIDEEHIQEGLKINLPLVVKQVLGLKVKLGGSAYKKLEKIQESVSSDGRLRNQFLYFGAHTGRWSGRGVQLQNLYKPDKAASEIADDLVKMIRDGSFIPRTDISTMTAIASTIRAAFCAEEGSRLIVGDLSQIESRELAALTRCKPMIKAYAEGHDLYKEFMADMLDKSIDEIDSDERARGKVAVLGCGYSMGWEKFIDYAATYGVVLEEKESKRIVYGFRERYAEIPAFWNRINNVFVRAMKGKTCIFSDGLVVDGRDSRMLKVMLPSGRRLHYPNPRVICERNFRGQLYDAICYDAFTEKGRQTKRLYGGLITENLVQAIARDILFNGMELAENMGFKIVATIHDETVTEVPYDSPLTLDDLLTCMKTLPEWSSDLTLDAEGFESVFYRK